jgi:hypothetical protein
MAFGLTTLDKITLSILKLSKQKLSIMTLGIMSYIVTLSFLVILVIGLSVVMLKSRGAVENILGKIERR